MLHERLTRELRGEVLFDDFSRGRYATDASIYQIMPQGVVVPADRADVATALAIARDQGIPTTPRGGGTSQCGQTVNSGLVMDLSKHVNGLLELDVEGRRAVVEPGIVLDELNRMLKPHGLWFPVDVSTASRATIGGMTANNSCGGRSLRYGPMRDNVLSIEAILSDGSTAHFGPVNGDARGTTLAERIAADMLALGHRDAGLIAERFPRLNRRVGGYNLDALVPGNRPINLAHLLVGSEGTLAHFTAIEIRLWPVLGRRALGVCHFPTFYQAMDAAQHLVTLKPIAVELVDATMIGLSRQIPIFRPTIERVVNGTPEALLLVEFDEGSDAANAERLDALDQMMGDLGFAFSGEGRTWGGMVPVTDPGLQTQIAEVRKSGLNIMMSMREAGKPVSFVEDCAVPLPDLAEYTERLTDVFRRHGTMGTWYAHASEGCLHVRPVLNLKQGEDVAKMRAIAEEAFELVAGYKGSHSGEHGDGIVRSEFHERMFGPEIVAGFRTVKRTFDPQGLFNPGKIVDPPKMDDRRLMRYAPGYGESTAKFAFDWSAWPGGGGGFQGTVEMCNNNGACRKLAGGAMCPSYRVTRNERDLVRGRANSLRLALSGQLGPRALTSDEMAETMKLCVGCKACKRECPTGVDMAKMKIEVAAARAAERGLSLHDRLVGWLPRYAPIAARLPWLANARDTIPGLARLLERPTGFAAERRLPRWSSDPFRDAEAGSALAEADVILWADTFNRWFEPENLRAAVAVLRAAGRKVAVAGAGDSRPLCCGRTYLSAGMVDQARHEARRLLAAVGPAIARGVPVVGLEPSCLLTLRDELPALIPGAEADRLADLALMFEEYIAREADAGTLDLALRAPSGPIYLHGHCHQKAHDVMPAVNRALALLPDAQVSMIESSCCGMAGAFGYGADTVEVSRKMAELSLLPAVRAAPEGALVVADGTSCRHQIADGAGRAPLHVARLFEMCLDVAHVPAQ
ncbi:MAG: FAD-binding and (Fe-S)-binding domain-containing protein [Alkalilacustris sp.]